LVQRIVEVAGMNRSRRVCLPPPMVNRNFTAARPNALWTTDLTYVPTRSGMA
jgi:transposase InsO family protein